MSRRPKIVLAVLVATTVALGALVWALPEIARRVAVSRIAEVTGRAASIEDIDLNLFTGRFTVKRFRLAERKGPEAFVEFDRIEGRVWLPAVLRRDIRLLDFRLVAPAVRIVRTGPTEFNCSDLLSLMAPSDPAAPPGPWTVTVERAAISAGKILAEDRVVSPAADWSVDGIDVELLGASSASGRPPGKLKMGARLGPSSVEMTEGTLVLSPTQVSARIKLGGFDLRRLRVYTPAGAPAVIDAGTVSVALAVEWKRGGGQPDRARVDGEVTVDALALSQPGAPAAFATLPRLVVQIKDADPLARKVTLGAVEIEGLDVKVVRRPDGTFDLLMAAAGAAPPDFALSASAPAPTAADASAAAATPPTGSQTSSAWEVRLDRLTVKDSRAVMTDQTATPAREWRIEALTVDGTALSLVRGDAPGSLQLKAQVLVGPGGAAPATVGVDLDAFRIEPLVATGRLSLGGLDLNTLWPYVRAGLPAALSHGTLALDLAAELEEGESDMTRATVSGIVRLADVAATQRGATTPFVTVPSVALRIRQIDGLQHTVALSDLAVEGAHVRVVRDAQGQIDLEALADGWAPPADGSAPPGEAAPPAAGEAPAIPRRLIVAAIQKALSVAWSVSLDRLALTKSSASFEDRLMSPPVQLTVTDLDATGQTLSWPAKGPATLAAGFGMPGGGHTELKLTGVPDPLDIQFAAATRDAPIEPYQAYFPFPARFRGKFSGDSLSEVKKEGDVYRAASRGTAWATEIAIEDPESPTAPFRMERMEIRDIDFSWPNYALVRKVTMSRPHVQVERSADGVFNLRRLFTPSEKPGDAGREPEPPTPAPTRASTPAGDGPEEATKAPLIQTIVLDFSEISIEEGAVRFLDRTTRPAFSEDMSHLNVTVRDLSNVLGRQRTTMTTKATVGDNATLDLRGELSGIGETLRADLVGEIRDFDLSTANPYADSVTAWVVERGKLQAKVHFRVEGDRISIENDVNFGGLKVAKGKGDDEAKKRLGLPLGLIVGLLKDTRGDIDFSLPLNGTLSDRSFDWGETIWAGVKQTVVKVLVGPFRAIGRLFTGGGEDKIEALHVEPVTFPAGSSVIAPAMEEHLVKVADFLRRSPYIDLTLSPVATASDAESLRSQALTARIERLREEKKLADFPAAVTAYWAAQKIDGPPPKTTEEQLAALRQREPAPDAVAVQALLDRRLGATREALTRVEGIPTERLVAGAARPLLDDKGEGRVEFSFDSGEPPPGQ